MGKVRVCEKPNARVKGRQAAKRVDVPLNNQLGLFLYYTLKFIGLKKAKQ